MLIGFIGSPGSGKTTIATSMFTNFKKSNIPAELIVEQARVYISEFKYNNKLTLKDKVVLSDDDQVNIAVKQRQMESYFKYACPDDTLIVSDSSMLNAFLYMTPNVKDKMESVFYSALKLYDLLFFCNPIENNYELGFDANRIHDNDTIKSIHFESLKLVEKIQSYGFHDIIHLTGELDYRVKEACLFTLQKRSEIILRNAS